MQGTIVYESMYGNTHAVAEEIAAGLDPSIEVLVRVPDEVADAADGAALLVVGGPPHLHGMSSGRSRDAAVKAAADDESLEVGWFALDALPALDEPALLRIKQTLGDGPTWFDPAGLPAAG